MLAALILSACDTRPPTQAVAAPVAPEVTVAVLQAQAVTFTSDLPGRTVAYVAAEVRPQVTGILRERGFEEGSEVKAGQVLYTIDAAPYRAALSKAQASLASARALAQRYERLIRSRAISQQEHDDARSQYLQTKAAYETASIDLGYTQVKAPISGRIGRSAVTQGALLTANQAAALATIQQLDPIYVDIVQSSTAMLNLRDAFGRVQQDQSVGSAQVNLQLDNGKRYAHAGTLQFSEVSVDASTGAVTLRAVFPNPDGLLLPGMFVKAQLQQGRQDKALLVPQRAVMRDAQGQAYVFVVDDASTAHQRQVDVARRVGDQWLIGDGLRAGERVVLDGVQNLRDGMAVTVAPAAQDADARR